MYTINKSCTQQLKIFSEATKFGLSLPVVNDLALKSENLIIILMICIVRSNS